MIHFLVQGRIIQFVAIALLLVQGGGPVSADGGANHQAEQSGTIQLGTSGGNIFDSSSRFCCSGTLGALVQDANGTAYILSNNHVLALGNLGTPGDGVNHPGMVDQQCGTNGVIANLSTFEPILFGSRRNPGGPNFVDAAIAVVTDPSVAGDGSILDIGPVGSSTLDAYVGLPVQKSGRTTGWTSGNVVAINVDVVVGYSDECGGRTKNYAMFVDQIRIENGDFSAAGDSGSLIVEYVAPYPNLPRAVGLLFAGSSTSTIANSIDNVLGLLGVAMVGGTPTPPPPSGTIAGVVMDDSSPGSPIAGASVSVDGGFAVSTDADGNYSISNVPVGTDHVVTASAPGFESASQSGVSVSENSVTTVNFALTAASAPTRSTVACVIYNTSGGPGGDKNLQFTVRAVDDFGQPIANAAVNISVDRNGSLYGTGSGALTNDAGEATYVARNAPDGTYVTTVTAIDASGLTFDGPGSTPANSFAKGTDSVPAEFCNSGFASGSGTAASASVDVRKAKAAKARSSRALLAIEGVIGHGVGVSNTGRPVIEVYLDEDSPSARAQIPASIEGIPVRVVVTGPFVAY